MRARIVLLLGLVTLLFGASAYADDDSDDKCRKTTKKCGTECVQPSEGYQGQCGKKDGKKKTTRKCGGCGKELPAGEDEKGGDAS